MMYRAVYEFKWYDDQPPDLIQRTFSNLKDAGDWLDNFIDCEVTTKRITRING